MQALNVTIVQADLHWHDAAANRQLFDAAIGNITEATDLIVLPEMFTTGFTMDARPQAEPMHGKSMQWMRDHAANRQAAVCGSLIIEDQERFFNRFVLMRPDGRFECYDKRHLFRLANEDDHYTAGETSIVFELNGWRVCPMICYDLRFPVWSRNQDQYDLLLYVANWPSRRHHAWRTLLRARAIENQAYVAAVNRCGTDGNDLPYLGGSAIVDYLGQDLADLGETAGQASSALSLADLQKFRDRFPFHKDADRFELLP